MKQKFLLALLSCLFFAYGASAQILTSWKDPGTTIQNPGVHKIVVAALINNPDVRKQIEDYMVTQYNGMATQSYIIFGTQPLNQDEQNYNQTLRNQGYDGIVMIHQTSGDVSQHFVPGQPPSYYRTWGGYWHNGWGYNAGTPGHVANDYIWYVQVNVYSTLMDKLIYAATARITDPGGRVPLFKNACDMVRGQMRTDQFLY